MLAFISDLHLTDGTCCEPGSNVDEAVEVLQRVAARAADVGSERIDLVLLGDALDLLRSEVWHAHGLSPASLRTNGQRDRIVYEILNGILANDENRRFFECVKGLTTNGEDSGPTGKVTYVIGNHDRLVGESGGQFGTILKEMFGVYAIETKEVTKFPQYQVLAVHGDHWDPWNRTWSDTDSRPCPYGDFIVLDLVNRFPRRAARELKTDLREDKKLQQFHRIEDVPHLLIPQWIDYRLNAEKHVDHDIIKGAWEQTAEHFVKPTEALEQYRHPDYYVKKTVVHSKEKRDDRKLRFELWILRALLGSRPWIGRLCTKILGKKWQWMERREDLRIFKRATVELRKKNANVKGGSYRFLVSGHTHRTFKGNIAGKDDFTGSFVNTGSFRPRIVPSGRNAWQVKNKALAAIFWRDQQTGELHHDVLKNGSFNTPEVV